MTRLLVLSSLYPNAAQPQHGVFVEERLRQLLAADAAEATVVAPVPWFPLQSQRFGRYATYARVPRHEQRHGIEVLHPRFISLPKIGMLLQPWFMARSVARVTAELLAGGRRFDVVDAHYLYPDGVAAARVARKLGLPLVLTARGSDVNVVAKLERPRRMILAAVRQSAAVVAVSNALRDALIGLGVDPDKVVTLRNGVDLARFRPMARTDVRASLGVDGFILLSVGKLDDNKGHALAIDALKTLGNATLLIAGDGPLRKALQSRASRIGVSDRVCWLSNVPPDQMPRLYNIADVLVQASTREGMPNAVLESLACGTPVVATAVGGIPELIDAPAAGVLMAERSVEALLDSVQQLRESHPGRQATRQHAQRFGWDEVVSRLGALLARATAQAMELKKSGTPASQELEKRIVR